MATIRGDYRIRFAERPEDEAWGIIGRGVHQYNVEHAGATRSERICFVLQAADDSIVGGVLGELHWDWLYVDLLWVSEELRGRGHGHALLEAAEDEARRRGARHAYLDTFSFQAPDFYARHSYRVFGELAEFPPGHRRLFLTKEL